MRSVVGAVVDDHDLASSRSEPPAMSARSASDAMPQACNWRRTRRAIVPSLVARFAVGPTGHALPGREPCRLRSERRDHSAPGNLAAAKRAPTADSIHENGIETSYEQSIGCSQSSTHLITS